ncbi:hypothetical protein [Aquimarina sediminis]|uniref:hypothetical protein n=1 Tax=Aquimarina sediminis TaxID=2070536 RepID=UPI000CA04BBE|nr:hypothetical protein [Aquimarina sediminis]
MNKKIIELVISLPVNVFTGKDIHNIFLEDLWFKPTKFYGYGITYGDKVFRKKYFDDVKKQKEDVSFTIWDKKTDNSFSVVRPVPYHQHQRIHIHFDIADWNVVVSKLEKHVLDKVITGYAAQYYDIYFQSAKNATAYRVKNMEPPKEKLIKNHIGLLEDIDISNNPGRADLLKNMWITSNWRMWFGKEFYKEVSKEHLKGFSQAHAIRELDNDVLFMELYEDPFAADFPENRKIQQAFRDYVKMDELIKRLK